jgi:hypothetical protein
VASCITPQADGNMTLGRWIPLPSVRLQLWVHHHCYLAGCSRTGDVPDTVAKHASFTTVYLPRLVGWMYYLHAAAGSFAALHYAVAINE